MHGTLALEPTVTHMKSSHYLTLLSTLILTTASWANEPLPTETVPQPHQERVIRRTSPQDAELKLFMRQQRATEQRAEEETAETQASTKKEVKRSDFIFASAKQRASIHLTSTYYVPDYTHWLSAVGLSGHTLDMEDGTRWEVMSSDSYRLNSWRLNDPIVVTPNYSWFASGDFYITNQNTNTYVRADLVVSPIAFGPYSHWIIGIDHSKGHVYLENGTTWKMSSGDYFVYRNWDVNDHIIMGYNDSLISTYDRILINFNMDSYVRAKQY